MPSVRESFVRAINRLVRPGLLQYRKFTAGGRALPSFIIIGTQKGGTTSLFHYLSQHPQLVPSYRKEVHYFDGGLKPKRDNFALGERWYRSNFPLRKHIRQGQQAFEASPLYVFHPLAPERIHALLPDAKLILLLREPTERALSHYFHQARKGRETLSVMDALQGEEARLAPVLAEHDYKHQSFMHFSYKLRGHYAEQIRRYQGLFPKENLLILGSEKFFSDPHTALRKVFEFVGVDSSFQVPNLNARNVGSNRKSVDADVYQYLQDYFSPHNQELYELLGEDFDW
ncbi:sulfotransferase [Alcanivorax sp. 1008]|uniref:sulfotransferase family protein n=1 Tax=Alcanivorax sp. 1008 TaxID=2816853 RepID=UPI001DCEF52E|nr:sulfotransferase [Alcanivorax sp. 1008]MCC1496009.1 sulfotransferase [Alcanivorax sp. 1008]